MRRPIIFWLIASLPTTVSVDVRRVLPAPRCFSLGSWFLSAHASFIRRPGRGLFCSIAFSDGSTRARRSGLAAWLPRVRPFKRAIACYVFTYHLANLRRASFIVIIEHRFQDAPPRRLLQVVLLGFSCALGKKNAPGIAGALLSIYSGLSLSIRG
jgi:hypothetical protein